MSRFVRMSCAHCKEHNGRRYTLHVQERMAPDTPAVRAKLEKRALAKGLAKNSKEFAHYVQPRGISLEEIEQAITNPQQTWSHAQARLFRRNRLKVVTSATGDVVITAVWEH